MRRAAAHSFPLLRGCIARAHPGSYFHLGQAALAQFLANTSQRQLQITLDIVRKRFQRRDVDHLRRIRELAFQALANERIDRCEKSRQCFARTGWGGNQRMPAAFNRGPGHCLCLGRRGKAALKPRGKRRVKQIRKVYRHSTRYVAYPKTQCHRLNKKTRLSVTPQEKPLPEALPTRS